MSMSNLFIEPVANQSALQHNKQSNKPKQAHRWAPGLRELGSALEMETDVSCFSAPINGLHEEMQTSRLHAELCVTCALLLPFKLPTKKEKLHFVLLQVSGACCCRERNFEPPLQTGQPTLQLPVCTQLVLKTTVQVQFSTSVLAEFLFCLRAILPYCVSDHHSFAQCYNRKNCGIMRPCGNCTEPHSCRCNGHCKVKKL